MSEAPRRAAELDRALRRVQWSVLGGIGVCALVAVSQAPAAGGVEVDRRLTVAALALAVGSILTRRTSARRTAHVVLALVSLLLAGTIALLGVVVALEGDRETALLYTLGSALLAARRPASVVA